MPSETGLGCSAAVLISYLSSVAISVGAEIKANPDHLEVVIEGEIQHGDYNKLVNVLKVTEISHVFLASSGGNISEAMKIGRLIRSLKMTTNIPVRSSDKNMIGSAKQHGIDNLEEDFMCTSACFFIFIAGIDREQDFPFLTQSSAYIDLFWRRMS